MIGLREQVLVHVFADDADAHALEARLLRKVRVTFARNAADAVHREIVGGIIAGDDVEHARGVFHRAAGSAVAVVEPSAADHAIAADQPLVATGRRRC